MAPVEDGEFDLRITHAMEKDYDSGAKALLLFIEIVGEDNADDIVHSLWLPTDLDTPKKARNKLLKVKEFMEAAGMDTSMETDPEDFKDMSLTAMLKQEPNYRDASKMDNVIDRVT